MHPDRQSLCWIERHPELSARLLMAAEAVALALVYLRI